MACIIDFKESAENMEGTSILGFNVEQLKKRSIYRLPDQVIDLDSKACMPQVVSFGPYHHGERQVKPMEEHKNRALLLFLKRSRKPLDHYLEALKEELDDLKDAYDQLDPVWQQGTAFCQLMIRDGCFILEILRVATSFFDYARDESELEYPPNDPVFSYHGNLYKIPFIRRDMLLLENQVPLRVLEILFAVGNDKIESPDEALRKLIHKFYLPDVPLIRTERCLHILDVYRKSLIREDISFRRRVRRMRRYKFHGDDDGIMPSATELHKAGVRFKRSKTTSLKDINFHGSTLSMPPIVIDADTKLIFLNLIAFERFHVGAGNDVISYTFFMDSLLRSAEDVSLLRLRGIIRNALRRDEDVAILFDLISTDLVVDPESRLDNVYRMVSERLRNRFRKRLNAWETDLVQTYFKSPWAAISVAGAILLFTLTIIQTVYTVLGYTHPKK